MNILEAIYSEIITTTAITSLSSNRVYPLIAPSSIKTPYITYNQISDIPVHAMGQDAPLEYYRIQISTWTTSFSQLVSISTQIKNVFRDLTGTMGSSNFNVQRSFFDASYDFPQYDNNKKAIVYHRAQDFIIWTTN